MTQKSRHAVLGVTVELADSRAPHRITRGGGRGMRVIRKARHLRVGDEIVWPTGRTARVDSVDVGRGPHPTTDLGGVWLTWSDDLPPYFIDPEFEFTLASGVIERDDFGG